MSSFDNEMQNTNSNSSGLDREKDINVLSSDIKDLGSKILNLSAGIQSIKDNIQSLKSNTGGNGMDIQTFQYWTDNDALERHYNYNPWRGHGEYDDEYFNPYQFNIGSLNFEPDASCRIITEFAFTYYLSDNGLGSEEEPEKVMAVFEFDGLDYDEIYEDLHPYFISTIKSSVLYSFDQSEISYKHAKVEASLKNDFTLEQVIVDSKMSLIDLITGEVFTINIEEMEEILDEFSNDESYEREVINYLNSYGIIGDTIDEIYDRYIFDEKEGGAYIIKVPSKRVENHPLIINFYGSFDENYPYATFEIDTLMSITIIGKGVEFIPNETLLSKNPYNGLFDEGRFEL